MRYPSAFYAGFFNRIFDKMCITVRCMRYVIKTEQPLYFQLAFALDRVRTLASKHPEWNEKEPFKSVLTGNLAGVLAGGLRFQVTF